MKYICDYSKTVYGSIEVEVPDDEVNGMASKELEEYLYALASEEEPYEEYTADFCFTGYEEEEE